jgi:hypothetical protein
MAPERPFDPVDTAGWSMTIPLRKLYVLKRLIRSVQ